MNFSIRVDEFLKPRYLGATDDECLSFRTDVYRSFEDPERCVMGTVYFHGTPAELLRFFEWGVEACSVARTEPAPLADQDEESVND